MKKISIIKPIVLVLSLLIVSNVLAQQESQYTHYMYNLMSVNPAYAGTTGTTNLSLLSRTQWVGFDDAPNTNNVSVHTPFRSGQTGAGISITSDVIGPISNLYIDLNYAHRVMLTKTLTLSLGIKGSILSAKSSLSNLVLGDPAFVDGSFFNPNFGIGAFLYEKNYYVGISIPRLIESEMSDESVSLGNIQRHYFFTAGYVYDLNKDIQLKPSFFAKKTKTTPFTWDVALEAMYLNKYRMGLNYRVKETISILAGIRLYDKLLVSYSYDVPVFGATQYSGGSHELYLSFDIAPLYRKRIESPRFF